MRITYVGPISADILASNLSLDKPLVASRRKYPFGAQLVLELLRQGHHVAVVYMLEGASEVSEAKTGECEVFAVPAKKHTITQYGTLFHQEVRGIRECIAKSSPDVVFAQWLYPYARAAALSGFPALAVARDSPWRIAWIINNWQSWFKALYSQLFVIPKLEHISAISPYMADELRRFNYYRKDLIVIPNAITVAEGTFSDKKIRSVGENIFCITDNTKRKNCRVLLDAFSRMKKMGDLCRLYLFGLGTEPNGMYHKYCKKRGIPIKDICFCGYAKLDDIRKRMYEDADLFISPTLEESFGLVFLEAMSTKTPCMGGYGCGAVPWVLDNGNMGFLANVRNADALAESLRSALHDEKRRKELSAKSHAYLKEHFSLEDVAQKYVKAFERII